MAQIQGSGAGNNTNTGFVDNSIEPQLGRLWVSSSGTSTQLYDGDGTGPAHLDESSHSLIGIDYEHHEIHTGGHFFTQGWTTTGNSGIPLNFSMNTPNGSKWVHLVFGVTATDVMEMKEYEATTLSGGNAMTIYNSNRNANDTTVVDVFQNPIISGTSPTSGTLLATARFGVASTSPSRQGIAGDEARSNELILRSGTSYLWEFKPGVNNEIFTWNAHWYEHTDKTQQF